MDSTGAAIKDAPVTAKDTDRRSIGTTRTDGAGIFTTTRIPVGNDSVSIQVAGFEKAVYSPFSLSLKQTTSLNIH